MLTPTVLSIALAFPLARQAQTILVLSLWPLDVVFDRRLQEGPCEGNPS